MELGSELGQVGFEGLLRPRIVICQRLTLLLLREYIIFERIYIWCEVHKLMRQHMLHCFLMYHEIFSDGRLPTTE